MDTPNRPKVVSIHPGISTKGQVVQTSFFSEKEIRILSSLTRHLHLKEQEKLGSSTEETTHLLTKMNFIKDTHDFG